MKPYNAGEGIWLRAETANEKVEQNAQTQYADGIEPKSVIYVTQLEAMSQH